MSKLQLGFLAGLIVTGLGVLLALGAGNLATRWEMIGPNAWGGTTDPDRAHLYQTLGLIITGFGLFLTGSTFYEWLSRPKGAIRREAGQK